MMQQNEAATATMMEKLEKLAKKPAANPADAAVIGLLEKLAEKPAANPDDAAPVVSVDAASTTWPRRDPRKTASESPECLIYPS